MTDAGHTRPKGQPPANLPSCLRILPVTDSSLYNHAITTHTLEADKAAAAASEDDCDTRAGGKQRSRRGMAVERRHQGRQATFSSAFCNCKQLPVRLRSCLFYGAFA